tara:strand:- start:2309 stop:2899 length:591 start_codon:yes stop_codon:yes gene_type:complete
MNTPNSNVDANDAHSSETIINIINEETGSDGETVINVDLSESLELTSIIDTRFDNISRGNYELAADGKTKTNSTNTEASEFLFNTTRENIKEQLNRTIQRDIRDTIKWRFIFRKSGDICELLALCSSLISTVLAFSSGVFNNTTLSFVAGCTGSISLALMRASSYSMKESKERNEQLNMLLEKSHIKYLPSLVIDG